MKSLLQSFLHSELVHPAVSYSRDPLTTCVSDHRGVEDLLAALPECD